MLYSHLEDYINELLRLGNITTPNQLNVHHISKTFEIPVRYWDYASEAVKKEEKFIIFLNKHLSKEQQWQDFGHELCHPLRHSGRQEFLPFPFIELQEWQANNFMYHFCVPTFMLEKMELPFSKIRATYLVAESFNVEVGFAGRRLNMYERKKLDQFQRMGGY